MAPLSTSSGEDSSAMRRSRSMVSPRPPEYPAAMRVSATCSSASRRRSAAFALSPPLRSSLLADQLAPTAVRVEQVGDGHLLDEAGAAAGGLERVEKGRLAAGERLREMREGGFPEVPRLLVEREIGRRDVVG